MLKLIRKLGESVRIGEDTIITILEINGNNIQIGITVPKNIMVRREEISQRIK